VSPRGVAVSNVRERLFEAAERVLAREGPGGLTNRAVTGEAGVAKGLLYNHFADLDAFVAELVLDRFRRVAEQAAALPDRAGQGEVAENLASAALALLASHGPALAALALARPGAAGAVRDAWQRGAPGFAAVEDSLSAYLEAEKRLGRVAEDTDSAAIALAIAGTMHHLLMTGWAADADQTDPEAGTDARVRRFVTALVRALAPAAPR
jgi:AcrR family transcriptional regulator